MDYTKLIADLNSYSANNQRHVGISAKAADAITDLLAREEAAEARAEKAEREKDALLKEFAGECGVCLHYEECSKNHYSCCDGGADWEWRGQKEE